MAVTVCHTINHVWSLSPERDETVEREFFAESDCRHRTVSHNAGTASISSQIAGTGLHVRLQVQNFMSDMQAQDFMSDMQAQDFMSDCRHRTSCQTASTGLHVRHAGTGLHVRLQAQDIM